MDVPVRVEQNPVRKIVVMAENFVQMIFAIPEDDFLPVPAAVPEKAVIFLPVEAAPIVYVAVQLDAVHWPLLMVD